MTELPIQLPIDPRLRDYLDAELRQAEVDFARLPRLVGRRARGGALLTPLLTAAVVLLVAVVAASQLLGQTSTGPGAAQLGADGLPTMVDGQPVLRLGDVFPAAGSASSFLVGGTLTLTSDPCPDLSGPSAAPCDESWKLQDAAGTIGIGLADVTHAPGFVRTTGALTVVRVGAAPPCGGCAGSYEVEAVVWRQPTKGPIPDNASPPQGGAIYAALVPDFVPALAKDGTTIAGYVPKRYLIDSGGTLPGTPSNLPQQPPEPVYAEDLTTLVGYMVPGSGFVALGSSASPPGSSESAAPTPAVSTAPSSDPVVDCGRLVVAACEQAIALAGVGHESELATATRIVADDSCPPSVACDRLYPFDSIVVFVTAGADTTGWYSFHVTGLEYSVPAKAEPWLSDLPAHIIQRLTAPASPKPAGG